METKKKYFYARWDVNFSSLEDKREAQRIEKKFRTKYKSPGDTVLKALKLLENISNTIDKKGE